MLERERDVETSGGKGITNNVTSDDKRGSSPTKFGSHHLKVYYLIK